MQNRPLLLSLLFCLAVLCLPLPSAWTQGTVPGAPQVTGLDPPSGQRGTTAEITLSGQRLDGTKQLMVRCSAYPDLILPVERGIKAEVTAASDNQVKAKLTLAPDTPPGLHEIRAVTAHGITPPQYFYVAQYAQVPEKEPNNSPGEANPLTLPVTVAGAIGQPEDRDVFSFTAKAGQTLIFDVDGFKRFAPPQNNQEGFTYLDPFIVLQDASGSELAYDDDQTRLDAFLAYKFTTAGKYFLTIRDTVYRGRGDFQYRLTIGERPTITAVFPPGGQQGTRVIATVYGYNLSPTGDTKIRTALNLPSAPGVTEYRVTTPSGISNAVPVMAGAGFEVPETEPNEKVTNATQVTAPVTCWGTFDSLQDVDAYRFQAQAGQVLVVQVTASRLGSPVDSYLTLMDRSGTVVARDDDGGGMPDARIQVTIPTTDEYVVFVRNQTRTGFGPEYFYRLSIRALQPTFSVTYRQQGQDRRGQPAMVPVDSIAVPQGGSAEFRVDISRQEGQSGDVSVALNAPPTVKGIKLEQITREYPKGMQNPPKETIAPNPVVKNGQNNVTIRISADPALIQPGTYFGVYLQCKGLAGARPFTVNQPFWLTVAPRS